MKLHHFVLGISLVAASGAAIAADSTTPPPSGMPATQSTPSTPTPPANTQTQATPATPTTEDGKPAAATPDPNEKICKKDAATGSRLPVCKTRKEWDDIAKDNPGF